MIIKEFKLFNNFPEWKAPTSDYEFNLFKDKLKEIGFELYVEDGKYKVRKFGKSFPEFIIKFDKVKNTWMLRDVLYKKDIEGYSFLNDIIRYIKSVDPGDFPVKNSKF